MTTPRPAPGRPGAGLGSWARSPGLRKLGLDLQEQRGVGALHGCEEGLGEVVGRDGAVVPRLRVEVALQVRPLEAPAVARVDLVAQQIDLPTVEAAKLRRVQEPGHLHGESEVARRARANGVRR